MARRAYAAYHIGSSDACVLAIGTFGIWRFQKLDFSCSFTYHYHHYIIIIIIRVLPR